MKVIFDSNVFDELVSGKLPVELFTRDQIQLYITHIQVDELNATPDKEKRAKLFQILTEARPIKIGTESFAIGTSRIGSAKIGDRSLNDLRTGKKGDWRHTHDALIGETAIKNGLTLITNEKKGFRNRVERLGGKVMSSAELLLELERIKQHSD